MGEHKRLVLLVLIMIVVCVIVGATAIGMVYEKALDRERKQLVNIAQSQARLMESMARVEQSQKGLTQSVVPQALRGIIDAHLHLRQVKRTIADFNRSRAIGSHGAPTGSPTRSGLIKKLLLVIRKRVRANAFEERRGRALFELISL